MYYKYYKENITSFFLPALKMLDNGIPLKADTYRSCSSFCKYCFANNLSNNSMARAGIKKNFQVANIVDMKKMIKLFDNAIKGKDDLFPFTNWCIRNKYFVELGTMGEAFQEEDEYFGVTYNFIKLLSDFNIPLYINTKLNLVCKSDKYKKLLIDYKAPIIICCSLSTTNDKFGKLYEPLSPLPSRRLEVLKELSLYKHITNTVYISPFIPGVTDSNIEEYGDALINANIKGGHLRDFFFQGLPFKTSFWNKYMDENAKSFEGYVGGKHVKYEVKKDFYDKLQKKVEAKIENFIIVGMKTKWFDLNPYHGKLALDYLSDDVKDGVIDFSIIPILRKIRENKDKIQLLYWNEIGFDKAKIKCPDRILTNEGSRNNIMDGGCSCNAVACDTDSKGYYIDGYRWLKDKIWNGFEEKPSGHIVTIEHIFPLKDKGEYLKDSDENYIYCYLPKLNWNLVKEFGQSSLFELDVLNKNSEYYVNYEDVKNEFITKRLGGIEDKWLVLNKNKENVQ